MDGPPPTKKRRIEIDQIDEYVKLINTEIDLNQKFKCLQSKTNFSIESLPDDPELLLSQIFQKCIDDALEESKKNKIDADRLGAMISSTLLDPDIWIPIREITDNTLDTILNRFLLVAQSKRKEGEGSLWGEPFTVNVTVLDKDSLEEHLTIQGKGKKKFAVKHCINVKTLIKVDNYDSYCLFYAMQLAKSYALKNDARRYKFYRYHNGIKEEAGKL